LATSLSGGAGIAARRIAGAQVNFGIDTHLYSANFSGTHLENYESILRRSIGQKAKSKFLTYFQKNLIQNSDMLVTPYSSNSTKNWNKLIGNPDVIHLHAFYNLLTIDALEQLTEIAPLVITMHDQRVITGGCHYSGSCEEYKRECKSCPQVHKVFQQVPINQLKVSKRAFESLGQVVIISPSQWLAKLAKASALLSGSRIEVLNNPVPATFCPGLVEKENNKEHLVVGFISENLHNPYKGFGVLVDALNRLPKSFQIEVKFIGKGDIPAFPENIQASQSHLNNPEAIARVIRTCDAIIVPSLQDNSPSVISESIMCGVPVIGSRVGGITEVLTEFSLPSFEKGDSAHLSRILLNFEIKKQVYCETLAGLNKFSYERSASKHLKLYQSIVR
jgi:glycosyltransferase involved in cell wall biosynthesis